MEHMEIHEIRHNNLLKGWNEWREEQLDRRRDATDRAFALALDISESYLNQMKSGRSKIGNKTARRIEKTLRKNKGWLDMIDFSLSPDEILLLNAYRGLSESGRKEIAGYLSYITAREKDPPKGKINTPDELYIPKK